MEALFRPRRVALVGASAKADTVGAILMENLAGYGGEVFPIHPAGGERGGRRVFARVADIPGGVDAAVVAVPAPTVVAISEECLRAGARGLIVVSSGFAEAGAEGERREAELAALCRGAGALLLGPNSLGCIDTAGGFFAAVARQRPRAGGLGVISQSGAFCTVVLDWAEARGQGISRLVSLGNQAGLRDAELLAALGSDENTRVIVVYLESLRSGDDFLKVAENVASKKPIVLLKASTTRAGAQAFSRHRGGIQTREMAYVAAFRRAGVIQAQTYEQLFDTALALLRQPLPAGDRVAIVTNAGGPGIMAADSIESAGLQVASLSEDSIANLARALPRSTRLRNPIDVRGDAGAEQYRLATDLAEADGGVDAILVLLTPQALTQPAETARVLARRQCRGKPVLVCFMGGASFEEARRVLDEGGVAHFRAPERAVEALRNLCGYATWRRRPPRVVTRFRVNRRRVERIIARQQRTGLCAIGEIKAKELLRAYEFSVPEGYLVQTIDEALEMAERLGYPLAMKVVSPDIPHKSAVGGVRLGLSSPEQIRDAFDLIALRQARQAPQARLEGIYLEKMVHGGREVILGMNRDEQLGPLLMFGLGGIFVEVMQDVAFHLAPITAEEAAQMLRQTRSFELLKGSEGSTVDLDAIAVGLQRISQLVTDFPQIQSLEIDPFLVGAPGTEPMVVDAQVMLRPTEKP
jgi:acetyltransferase